MSRLVILGAGYAGLRAALSVSRLIPHQSDLSVTLVERGTVHQLITELHRIAAGTLSADAARLPLPDLLRGSRVVHRQAEVTGIDPATRVILTDTGPIPYDVVIVALGSVPDYHAIPGLAEASYSLKSIADAEVLVTRLRDTGTAPELTNQGSSVLIGGAGWTGIELATELAGNSPSSTVPQLTIRIVEAGAHILPGFPAVMIAAAHEALQQQRITLDLHAPVTQVQSGAVVIAGHSSLAPPIIIWTGGVRGPQLLHLAGLPVGAGGRVLVDRFLQAEGIPGVYVAGDCAQVLDPQTGRTLGPSAQIAIQQGEIAAYNVVADLRGGSRLPYRPTSLGEAMSLGRHDGIAIVGPVRLRGHRALAAKRAITVNYVRSLLGPMAAGDRLRRGL